jgi:hypothetical protein
MSPGEELVKIRIELPDDEKYGGESFWAKPLGNDLYELRNTPFLAFDLHFRDIVRAVTETPDQLPLIREVVERSGHKTLRIIFQKATSDEKQQILSRLNAMHAFYEKANNRLYAIDVEPQGDYQAVCDYLWSLEQQGVLAYETGTTRE